MRLLARDGGRWKPVFWVRLRDRFCKWVLWHGLLMWKIDRHPPEDTPLFVVLQLLRVDVVSLRHKVVRLEGKVKALEQEGEADAG